MLNGGTCLDEAKVRGVLDRIGGRSGWDPGEEPALDRLSRGLDTPEFGDVLDVYRTGSFASPPEIGLLLYSAVRSIRPEVVVELGTSYGFSTLHIAAALRDNGHGTVITAEIDPRKVRDATWNFTAAGLASHVEVLPGDAVRTFKGFGEQIDLVYLDGWVGSYLDALTLLQPALRPGAQVYANSTRRFEVPARPYLDHVRNSANGFFSMQVPLGHGLEASTYVSREPSGVPA
ncbi:class I SAM-dependent methyltransferase [Amycolatopsis sp. NPDC051128]|uniref:O-methyltransferase n=1 Tax=Amycolatopsis sp. NPDC051128 TaxID=3155412 RepID=UPI003434B273